MGRAPGEKVTDRVELVRPLGEGSMGEIWVGRHLTLQTDVAVKFMSASSLEHEGAAARFRVEAAAAARIKSPHVVRVFDHGETPDGTAFIVMELLEGRSLQERLDAEGPLSPELVHDVLRQVALALDEAHDKEIVHRDVKPQNIVLTEHRSGDVFVKLVDFGSAKLPRGLDPATGERLTQPGMLIGTPGYVSRDLVEDAQAVDARADLWALGVVAYKCLTGELPFRGEELEDLARAIQEGRFTRPSRRRPDLPKALDDWFAMVFAHDASRRPDTASSLARSFQEALSRPDPAPATSFPKERLLLAVLVAAGLGVGAVIALRVGGETAPGPAIPSPTAPSASSLATVASPTSASGASAAPPEPSAAPSATSSTSASASPSAEPPPDDSATVATSGVPDGATHPDPPMPIERAPDALVAALAAQRVPIPAGEFFMGCAQGDADCAEHEKPGRRVYLDAYTIDRVEVSVALYTRCVQAGVCNVEGLRSFRLRGGEATLSTACNWGLEQRQNHPLNCVDYEAAHRFCYWVDARLPTEAEWEKAARGTDGRKFPWSGDFAVCTFAVMAEGAEGCRAHGTWPTGSKPGGKSPFGVFNMAGNVREWVADRYLADYFATAPAKNPPGPNVGGMRVVKGGGWANAVGKFFRASVREGFEPDTRATFLGFRCAR